jgi:hypothetical protein
MVSGVRLPATLVLLTGAFACGEERARPAASSPASTARAPAALAAFGQPLASDGEVASLADVAAKPSRFKGKTITTEGTVARVCQERGCWMALEDASAKATVRMHGHRFFVPTTSTGKHARVQGTVVLMKDGRECDDMTAVNADVEIDAVGVELQ